MFAPYRRVLSPAVSSGVISKASTLGRINEIAFGLRKTLVKNLKERRRYGSWDVERSAFEVSAS
jgi:hypothetical protein